MKYITNYCNTPQGKGIIYFENIFEYKIPFNVASVLRNFPWNTLQKALIFTFSWCYIIILFNYVIPHGELWAESQDTIIVNAIKYAKLELWFLDCQRWYCLFLFQKSTYYPSVPNMVPWEWSLWAEPGSLSPEYHRVWPQSKIVIYSHLWYKIEISV